MKLDEIEKISVLGAGLMGHGIAQRFAMGGYSVKLFDVNRSILDTAKGHIQKNLELFQQFDLIGEGEIEPSLNRIQTTMDLQEAVKDADFVVEGPLRI